jgi:hypothetical protein
VVAVLADTDNRFEDEHDRVHLRPTLVGSYPVRRSAPAVSRRPAVSQRPAVSRRPAVSQRVAANRRLAVVLAALAIALVSLLFALQAALGGGAGGPLTTGAASAGAPRPAAVHAWLVRPGDTLWSIAVAVHPRGDVRPLVDRLSAQVGGRPLMVGQRLILP